MLNAEEIRRQIPPFVTLKAFDSLDSTNTTLKAWAREGILAPALLVVNQQRKGRGRFNRAFYSPTGGVYCSLLLNTENLHPGHLTTLAAVVCQRTIKALSGTDLQIKWVNDLLIGGQKVGGILTEGILLDGKISQSVIGIGINVKSQAFPEDLAPLVTTLEDKGIFISREDLIAGLVNGLIDSLPLVPAHMEEYQKHCLTLGQTVRFELDKTTYTGVAQRVDDEGALMVQTRNGLLRLFSGEISLIQPRP